MGGEEVSAVDVPVPAGWFPYSPQQQSGQQGEASSTAEPGRRANLIQGYLFLSRRGEKGATWREYAAIYGLHHGQASGVLSNLHRTGMAQRLKERRGGCGIYVTTGNVDGRTTVPHRSNRNSARDTAILLRQMAEECTGLNAPHHPDCWQEHPGCALLRAADIVGGPQQEEEKE